MSWFGWLAQQRETLDHLATRPNGRNFSGKVTLGEGGNEPADAAVKGDRFRPEHSYFSVRVVEMRLAEAGRYFTDYVPMCSCFLRYTYGRSERTLPFVLGSETISAGLGQDADPLAARNVEFRNVYIVRNVPMKADNLSMYTALCRFKDSGFARGLLDLFADAAAAVTGPAIGTALRTGVDLTKRLATLLGTDGVETRFGMLNGSALDESGYRLCAGAADLGSAKLLIRNGQLLRARDGGETTIDDADYLVLALEYLPTLVDEDFAQVSILPFHAHLDEVRSKLLSGDVVWAECVFKQLKIDLAVSPDVTEADRLALILAYQASFDQWASVAGGRKVTMGAKAAAPLYTRFPTAAAPEIAAVLQSARAGIVEADGRIRRAGDAGMDNLGRDLGLRASVVSQALQRATATDTALAAAASALLAALV